MIEVTGKLPQLLPKRVIEKLQRLQVKKILSKN